MDGGLQCWSGTLVKRGWQPHDCRINVQGYVLRSQPIQQQAASSYPVHRLACVQYGRSFSTASSLVAAALPPAAPAVPAALESSVTSRELDSCGSCEAGGSAVHQLLMCSSA